MTAKSNPTREARLAAALKENLKRRKAQTRAKVNASGSAPKARLLGVAPQAGLEDKPQGSPKAAPKPK